MRRNVVGGGINLSIFKIPSVGDNRWHRKMGILNSFSFSDLFYWYLPIVMMTSEKVWRTGCKVTSNHDPLKCKIETNKLDCELSA